MNWSDIKGFVSEHAPKVGLALGGPAGGMVGALVSAALGVENTPDAVHAALAQDPQAIIKLKELEMQHAERITQMHLEAETARIAENAANYRAELNQNDNFTKRWRPTFGYIVAFSFGLQQLSIWGAFIYIASTAVDPSAFLIDNLAEVISASTVTWGAALAVFGIQVRERGKDKQLAAGLTPTGLFDGFKGK